MNSVMKSFQKHLLESLTQTQEKLDQTSMLGESGGGKIQVVLSGQGELLSLKIDPALLAQKDPEFLEDLILVAFRNAKEKIDAFLEKEREKVTQAFSKLPF
jgi:DNA-binding YbaB/EbfC family protein